MFQAEAPGESVKTKKDFVHSTSCKKFEHP